MPRGRREATPASQSQADDGEPASQAGITEEETAKLTAEVVRYVLFKNHQHPGVPIKRRELTLIVTENYKQRGLPSLVIELAKRKLTATFGLELKALDRPPTADAAAGEEKYVLQSTVPEDLRKQYVETKETAAVFGFTIVLLGILQLAGENVTEEVLFYHLNKLGIEERTEHPVFGNIRDALDTAVKQRYVQRPKPVSGENEIVTYELAEKALDKQVQAKVAKFIDSVMKN